MTVDVVRVRGRVLLIGADDELPDEIDAVYGTLDTAAVSRCVPGVYVSARRRPRTRHLPFDTPVDVSVVDVTPDRSYL